MSSFAPFSLVPKSLAVVSSPFTFLALACLVPADIVFPVLSVLRLIKLGSIFSASPFALISSLFSLALISFA